MIVKQISKLFKSFLLVTFGVTLSFAPVSIEAQSEQTQEKELMQAKEAMRDMQSDFSQEKTYKSRRVRKNKTFTKAEAFVAGRDWEFDGFVAGGQDSKIKSMFSLNDLVYLNIGEAQGIEPGDVLSIYRRGDKVRDPQTRKFIGYEVRRAAISKATNKVDQETCVARIIQSYEGVELGDLVRKDE